MSLAITTVGPFHTPILHDQAHILQYTKFYIQAYHDFLGYYFVNHIMLCYKKTQTTTTYTT